MVNKLYFYKSIFFFWKNTKAIINFTIEAFKLIWKQI